MKVKLNTIMAHPTLGCAEPGAILDLPETAAKELIEAGAAEAVGPRPLPAPATTHESEHAMDDRSEHESAMLPGPRGRMGR